MRAVAAAVRPVLLLMVMLLACRSCGAQSSDYAGPNVLVNGDFSTPAAGQVPAGPAHWDIPDGLGVQWAAAPGGGQGIRMDTAISEQAMVAQWHKVGNTTWDIPHAAGNAIAETYGLSLYSQAMPVLPGRSYRISYDFLGPAGGVKLWVRGYGLHNGEKQRLWEAVVNGTGDGPAWKTTTMDVHPTRHRYAVTELKIMLYAYYPAGVYWFRNIRLQLLPEDQADRDAQAKAAVEAAAAAQP